VKEMDNEFDEQKRTATVTHRVAFVSIQHGNAWGDEVHE